MFELTKLTLQKVSFDKKLFKKELMKGIGWLKKDEAIMLKVWCLTTFGNQYAPIVREVFKHFV
jgi:hypothetical protein